MKFFKFFKQKDKNSKISLEEAERRIEKLANDLPLRLNEISLEIGKAIEEFKSSSLEKIRILEEIDLSSKREDERLKRMTLQGLDSYLNEFSFFLKKLDSKFFDLGAIEKIEVLDSLFKKFFKRVESSFHRATILIGEEMAQLHQEAEKLYDRVLAIRNDNSRIFSRFFLIRDFEENKKKIAVKEEFIRKEEEELERISLKVEEIKRDVFEAEKNLEKHYESFKRKSFVEGKARVEGEIASIESEVRKIGIETDFKGLCKVYHKNRRLFEFLSSCRKNFLSAFLSDEWEILKEVLDKQSWERLNFLRERYLKALGEKENFCEDVVESSLRKRILNLRNELSSLGEHEVQVKKRISKTKEEIKSLIDEKKSMAEKILGEGFRIF
ncbi:hypothetical protein D6829_00270 [Candidatus Pacearchaeota archaeon]|nr:MAG: hypothetical protein D6829_00270 [Candidatus Pacearchaeota archaeon]